MSASQFLQVFLDEAAEMLERWEAACLELERSVSDETIDALFRQAHNLKGSSRSVGLEAYGAFVHLVEDVITLVKSRKLPCTPELIGLLLECQSTLMAWTEGLRDNPEHQVDTAVLRPRLETLAKGTPVASTDGGWGLFEDGEAKPVAAAPKDLGTILMEKGHATPEQIDRAVRLQNRRIGEILADEGLVKREHVDAGLRDQKRQGHRADEAIRVSTRKLDAILRAVGELSIHHSILQYHHQAGSLDSPSFLEAMDLTAKTIQSLQTEALGLRMQPLDGLFQRLERAALDVARSQGKQLTVVRVGDDVELDKTVIEKIKDPMVHLVRNAIDHGVETPEVRQAAGKATTGTLTIEALQGAGQVSIKIRDNGRGLATSKIRAKAEALGLTTKGAPLTDDQIHGFVFAPGFSTAEKVTDISGRGVGMDVVRRAVDELGGHIAIASRAGHGATFDIALPANVSLIEAFVIKVHDLPYVIPAHEVTEVVDLTKLKVEQRDYRGRVLSLRGQVMQLEPLAEYLALLGQQGAAAAPPSPSQGGVGLIVAIEQKRLAFGVDEVVRQQQVVVRPPSRAMASLRGISGVTILGDGQPSLIIDLVAIGRQFFSGKGSAAGMGPAATKRTVGG